MTIMFFGVLLAGIIVIAVVLPWFLFIIAACIG